MHYISHNKVLFKINFTADYQWYSRQTSGNRSEQSLVWWLYAHQADIDRGLTAVMGLVLECFEQPRIAGVCNIAHARDLAIFAWIQSFYILKGDVVAFTHIIYY